MVRQKGVFGKAFSSWKRRFVKIERDGILLYADDGRRAARALGAVESPPGAAWSRRESFGRRVAWVPLGAPVDRFEGVPPGGGRARIVL